MALSLRAASNLKQLLTIGSRAFSINSSIYIHKASYSSVKFNQDRQYKNATNHYNLTHQQTRSISAEVQVDHSSEQTKIIHNLNKRFANFEDICSRIELVHENDFVRLFDQFTQAVDLLGPLNELNNEFYKKDLALIAGALLRCCGKNMLNTTEKARELLAGNLWQFMKEKNIPVDLTHYNNLVRTLNENQTNFDPQKILDELQEAGLVPDRITYQRLIHQYCLQGNVQGATKLLESMKEQSMDLNESIFASLIIGYSKQAEPPSVNELFDIMRSNGIEPGSNSYTAAILSKAIQAKDNPAVLEEIKALFKMAKTDEILFNNNQLCDLLAHLIPLKEKHEVVEELLRDAESSLRGAVPDRYRILLALVRAGKLDHAADLYWKQKLSERALQIGKNGAFWIDILISQNVQTEFVLKQCDRLVSEGHFTDIYPWLYYKSAQRGRLDLVRYSLTKLADVKCAYYWPLIAQAKDEQELFHALKNDFNPRMNGADLVDTFAEWVLPKLDGNIQKLHEANERELHYDRSLLNIAYLEYSVNNNKIEEAAKFISESSEESSPDTRSEEDVLDRERYKTNRARNDMMKRLLEKIVEQTNDPNLAMKAFEMCHLPKQKLLPKYLTPLIEVHLRNDDFNGAVEKYAKLCNEYKVAPATSKLMSACLEKKDPEALQKVMQVASDTYGESNALLDLALCCLKANKLNQAQKLFKNPGLRIRPDRVYAIAESFMGSKTELLENFVELTRDIYGVDSEILYGILIEHYHVTSNAKRAIRLWNSMQDEDFQPNRKIMIMIADLLEKNGLKVPFQKPSSLEQDDPRNNNNRRNRY